MGRMLSLDTIDLSMSHDKRDFGRGFYTTTIYGQAVAWAKNMYIRKGEGQYVYQVKYLPTESLQVKRFNGLTVDWLDMVKANRTNGGIQHAYDVVIGPVANDDTMRTVAYYVNGVYTAAMAIEQLKYKMANDQISFHTAKALEAIRIIKRIDLLNGEGDDVT